MRYLLNLAIALDQLLNALLGGSPDETLSARAWRRRDHSLLWVWIDLLFFWQRGHCEDAYKSEVERKQLPSEYRK